MTSGDVYKLCEEIRDISGHTFKADAYCRVVAVVEGGGGGGAFKVRVISTNSQSRYLKSFFCFFGQILYMYLSITGKTATIIVQ